MWYILWLDLLVCKLSLILQFILRDLLFPVWFHIPIWAQDFKVYQGFPWSAPTGRSNDDLLFCQLVHFQTWAAFFYTGLWSFNKALETEGKGWWAQRRLEAHPWKRVHHFQTNQWQGWPRLLQGRIRTSGSNVSIVTQISEGWPLSIFLRDTTKK